MQFICTKNAPSLAYTRLLQGHMEKIVEKKDREHSVLYSILVFIK